MIISVAATACLKTGESGFVEENATWAQLRRHYAACDPPAKPWSRQQGFGKFGKSGFPDRKARRICYNAGDMCLQASVMQRQDG
jgi:hypothetical protein